MQSHYSIVPQRERLDRRNYALRGMPLLPMNSLRNPDKDTFLCVSSGGSDAYNRFLAKRALKHAKLERETVVLPRESPVPQGTTKRISQDEWDTYVDWSLDLIGDAPSTMLIPAFIKSLSRREEVHQAFQAYFELRMAVYLFDHNYTTEKAEYIVANYRNTRRKIWRLEEKIKTFVEREEVRRQAWNASYAVLQETEGTAIASPYPIHQMIGSTSKTIQDHDSEYEDTPSLFLRKIHPKASFRNTSPPDSPKKSLGDISNVQKSLPQEEIDYRKRREHALADKMSRLENLKCAVQKYTAAYRTYAKIFLPYAKKLTLEFEDKWSKKGPHTLFPIEREGVRLGATNFDTIKTLLSIGTLRHGLHFNESNPLVYANHPNEINQRRKEPGFHSIEICGRLANVEPFRSFIPKVGSVIHEAHQHGTFPYTVIMPPEEFELLNDMIKEFGIKGIQDWSPRFRLPRPIDVARECQSNARSMLRFKKTLMVEIVNSGLRRRGSNIARSEATGNDKRVVLPSSLPEEPQFEPKPQQELEIAEEISPKIPNSRKRASSEMSGGETHKRSKTRNERRRYEANDDGSEDNEGAEIEDQPETPQSISRQ